LFFILFPGFFSEYLWLNKPIIMGFVYAEIELISGVDVALAGMHHIGEEEIKRITVTALVDSGSYMLAINENIQEYLQLPVVDKRKAQLATGEIIECDIVSPIELRFKNRGTTCRAMVLPGDAEVLMGSIPLEDLDVLIDPLRQELIIHPDHPDMAYTRL
jgi:clan AA aspartic protease